MNWMNYSKLIAAIAGNLVAIVVVYLAAKGLATCSVAGDADSCTLFGFSTGQITATLMLVANALFVHQAPPNGGA